MQDRRGEVQAVVWLLDTPDGEPPTRSHPHRMSGDPKEAAVVPARVEVPRIEIPAISGKDMKIRIDESASPSLVSQHKRIHSRMAGNVLLNRGHLFRDTDHSV